MTKKKDVVKEETQVEQPMRDQLLNLVKGMKKDGFSFVEKHPVFTWKYEEEPDVVFSLQIKEISTEEPDKKDDPAIIVPNKEIVT